jgi:hypothetical protein
VPCGEGQERKWKTLSFQRTRSKAQQSHIHVLALRGRQTVYDIYKEVRAQKGLRQTRYANVNKRARALEESGYIKKIGTKKTKAGFQASTYDLTTKAYLAILLNSINLDELVKGVYEATALTTLGTITSAQFQL